MRSIAVKFPLLVSLLVLAVSLAVSAYWWNFTRQHLYQQQLQEIETKALEQGRVLTNRFANLSRQVRYFAESQPVREIARRGLRGDSRSADAWMDACADSFETHLSVNPEQFQIRLIGLADHGREVVRVERVAGKVVRTPENRLQSKGSRDYFTRTIRLRHGGIYYSTIDLNIEHGKVVTPHQPTVRTATPVFSGDGRLYGMLIINTDVSGMLRNFSKTLSTNGRRAFLLNRNGSFIVHPDPARRFGSELGHRFGLSQQFGAAGELIRSWSTRPHASPIATFETDGVILTAFRIPLNPNNPRNTLLGIVQTPKSRIQGIVAGSLSYTLLITLGLVVLSIVVAVLFVRHLTQPLATLTRVTENIASGRGKADILPVSRGDEIGTLSRAFREMHEGLQQREASLLESRERISAVLNSVVNAVITIDEHGIIESVNPATEKLFGYGKTEMIGRNVSMLMPQPHRDDHDGYLRHYLETGEKQIIGIGRELTALNSKGHEFPIFLSVSEVRISGQRIFTGAIVDITDIKQAEQELLKHTEKLERVNRELSEFAYVASHDLQEPLRKIRAFTDRLNKRLADEHDERTTDYLQRINSAASRMGRLIEDLLSLSRVDSRAIPFEKVNLGDIAREVVSDLEGSIELHHGRVELGKLGCVSADPAQMRALLQNLIGNALKFHRPDKNPLVRVCELEEDSKIYYHFTVDDNGIGIQGDHRQRIFKPFARLHNRESYEGTGMGLAICRKVIERHGGTIRVEDSELGGARFIVSLPKIHREKDGE